MFEFFLVDFEKAAPPTNRTGDEETRRRAPVEEADARWKCLEAAWKLSEKKALELRLGAIEEEFISYSPMSDIVQDEADDVSVDTIPRRLCRTMDGTASAPELALEMLASLP